MRLLPLLSAVLLWSSPDVIHCWHPNDIVVASTSLIRVYNNPPDRDASGVAIPKYQEASPTLFNYDCQFVQDTLTTIGLAAGGHVGVYDILTKTGTSGGGSYAATSMVLNNEGSLVYVGQRANTFSSYVINDTNGVKSISNTPAAVFTTQDAATTLALSSDETTMFYAEGTVTSPSSAGTIFRIHLTTGQALENYCTNLEQANVRIDDMVLLGPSYDGSDGMILMANGLSSETENRILRIDANCTIQVIYPVQGSTWSALAMDVDETTFWATKTSGELYQFDIESGGVVDYVDLALTNDFAYSVCIYNGTLSEDRTEPPTPAPSLRNPLFSEWKEPGDIIIASDGRPQGSLVSVYSNPPLLTDNNGFVMANTNLSSPVRANYDCAFHESRLFVTGDDNLVIIDGYDSSNPSLVLTDDFSPRGLAIANDGQSVYLGRDDEASIALFARGNYPDLEQFFIQKYIDTQVIPRTLELSSDGTTLFYAEGESDNPTAPGQIFRVNGVTGAALSPFANLGAGFIVDMILLPPSRDGSDGMLVICNGENDLNGNRILRLNAQGQQITDYSSTSGTIKWGGIGLDLDGTSFWAATIYQALYHLDLNTGQVDDLVGLATAGVSSLCIYPGASNEGESPSSSPSLDPTTSMPTFFSSETNYFSSNFPSSTPSQVSPPSSGPSVEQTTSLPTFFSSETNYFSSNFPSLNPSASPSMSPSSSPTSKPSAPPSSKPSQVPSRHPSQSPSNLPSGRPSISPVTPTDSPVIPTASPITPSPTESPANEQETDGDDDDDNGGTTTNTGNTNSGQAQSGNFGVGSSSSSGGDSYSMSLLIVACIVGAACIAAVAWACCFLGRGNTAKPVAEDEGPHYYDDPESDSLNNESNAFDTSNWE